MSRTRYASVLGLGFGDCGKGHFIDALTRRWRAHTIVRFNGGAQAGHNVVTADSAGDGAHRRHHTFSQFGSGTFVPEVRTLLLDPTVLHPTALLVEAGVLGQTGIHDALSRMLIDAQCRITTPYHQAAGRLRELIRGATAHGTCGVGVGETVRHSLEHPRQVMRYGDFSRSGAAAFQAQRNKLQAIRETLLAELKPQLHEINSDDLAAELKPLQDESLATTWLNHCRALARQCPPARVAQIHEQLMQPGCVLFEGPKASSWMNGVDFIPHTTWSSITTHAVDGVAARYGIGPLIEHYGVLRSYLTRHGNGPMPTHDASLDDLLDEPHNHAQGWQGVFRRGHPDAVLLRYALEAAGTLRGLLIGHLDVFGRGVVLKWCDRYEVEPGAPLTSGPYVNRLPMGPMEDLEHQEKLTEILLKARPQYDREPIFCEAALRERITSVTDLPVIFSSYGPTAEDVRGGWG